LVLALVMAGVASSPTAQAAEGPPFQFQFPRAGEDQPGSGSGQFNPPWGIATNPSGTEVYVTDPNNSRVDVFSPWGRFKRAFGWGVADGSSPELQTCTATCFQGMSGSGAGEFQFPTGIAVNSAGDVYVIDSENNRIEKFTPSGEFVLTFGGEVDKTTNGNICTAASGDVCGAGVEGSGQGEFQQLSVAGTNLAIAPDDTVYVGDLGRIQAFKPDGTFEREITLPKERAVRSLAADPSTEDIYFIYTQIGLEADPHVYQITPAGAPVCTASLQGVEPAPRALAVGPEGSLFVVNDPNHGGVPEFEPFIEEFNSNCVSTAAFGREPMTGYDMWGLATNRLGDLYVSVAKLIGSGSEPALAHVSVYGPLPSEIEPAPEEAPTIAAQYAASVSTTSAVLRAQVNPHFFGSTTVYVEYGTEDCSQPGSSCAIVPSSSGIPLGGGERDANIISPGISLAGLSPETTYYFRFVATSGNFTTRGLGSGEAGPSGKFTTRRVSVSGLPDSRAYEKVSPSEKNQGEVVPTPPAGGATELFTPKPLQASPSGEAITFTSFASFGEAEGAPGTSQYLARRSTSGWQTLNLTPPARAGRILDPLRGFSDDLEVGAVVQRDPPLVPGAPALTDNLYLQDTSTGTLRLLTPAGPRLKGLSLDSYCVSYFGASANTGHVIFSATGALTQDAPEGPVPDLYEWTEASLRLVAVLPNGEPAPLASGTGFGGGQPGACEVTNTMTHHAISADGLRIFWTYGGTYLTSNRPLFARVNGTETVQLDAVQGGVGPGGEGRFWGASADGSKVFFTDPNKLVSGARAGDLYRYDFNAPVGKRLVDLTAPTAAEVVGVLGASEDGSRVYFVGRGKLGEEGAVKGERNLYLWVAGEGVRFIAILSGGGDESNWGGSESDPNESRLSRQTARISPDGHSLAFLSSAPLTGYDNTDQASGNPDSEAYLYNADTKELVCTSCNATGAAPLGPTELPSWSTPFEQPRYLSDDGNRLFFESFDALVQQDTNGKLDVYEYERLGAGSCTSSSATFSPVLNGCTFLISGGTSSDATYLLDASANGRDVFISTRQPLVPEDTDGRYDVYDAREGGGFPSTSSPTACASEACRLPSAVAPGEVPPPSSTLSEAGNVKPKHHRRHKKHHHHKHKKVHKRKGSGK
jgi:DNA-binding beta-propeller fold protein YncE